MLKATHLILSIIMAVSKFMTICNADLLIKYRGVKYFYANPTYKNFIISYAFVLTFYDILPNTLKL